MKLLDLLTSLVVTVSGQYLDKANFVKDTARVTNDNLARLTNANDLMMVLVQGESDADYFDIDSFKTNKNVAT
jgi:hypothetical protein